jgi:hypothetical protein
MDMRVGLFLAIGYFMMTIYVHTASYAEGKFKLSYGKLGPTEVRIVVFIGNIIMPFWNPVVYSVYGDPIHAVDIAGIAVGIVFLVIFGVCSIRDARELNRLDRGNGRQ